MSAADSRSTKGNNVEVRDVKNLAGESAMSKFAFLDDSNKLHLIIS